MSFRQRCLLVEQLKEINNAQRKAAGKGKVMTESDFNKSMR